MRNPCLLLVGILLPLFLSAQTRPKSEAERRAWARSVYKEAILNHDSLQLAEAYYLLGKLENMTSGNYLKVRLWYLKALWILEKYEPSYELARLYLRLGDNELTRENYKEALLYFYKALSISKVSGSDPAAANTLAYLGHFYAGYGQHGGGKGTSNPYINFDSAASYYDQAEHLVLKIHDKEGLANITVAKEKLSMMRGTGIDHSLLSRTAVSVSGQRNTVEILTLLTLAESFSVKKDFEEALVRLDKAKKIQEEYLAYDRIAEQMVTDGYLAFYEKKEDWSAAYHLLKQKIKKEPSGEAWQAEEVSTLKNYYESEQKEIVLQSQEEELKLQRENIRLQQSSATFMELLIVLTVLSAIVFYLLYRKNRRISRQNALLVQEQSHRFRNHLQVVSDLMGTDPSTATEEGQARLSVMAVLHRQLYRKDQLGALPLDRFFKEIVSGILEIFGFRQVEVTYAVPALEASPEEALSLGLVVSELTTNACKYAFPGHPAPRYEITMESTGHEFVLRVKDNGLNNRPTRSGTSFGMKIIDLQVRQLNGKHLFYEEEGWVFEMRYKGGKGKKWWR